MDPPLWNCSIAAVNSRCSQYPPVRVRLSHPPVNRPDVLLPQHRFVVAGQKSQRQLFIFPSARHVPEADLARRHEEHDPHHVLNRERIRKRPRVPVEQQIRRDAFAARRQQHREQPNPQGAHQHRPNRHGKSTLHLQCPLHYRQLSPSTPPPSAVAPPTGAPLQERSLQEPYLPSFPSSIRRSRRLRHAAPPARRRG